MSHTGVALGGTMFHFNITGDFLGVWYNIMPNNQKRGGYYAISRSWGIDTSGMNTSPVVHSMDIQNSTAVVSGQPFTVTVGATDPDGDTLTHYFSVNSKYIDESGNTVSADVISQNGNTFQLKVPDQWNKMGVWKLYDFVSDGHGNIAVEARSFKVVPPIVEGTNIALGKTATASSFDPWNGNWSPGQAVDGDYTTRWASNWTDNEWIQVDLGSIQSFYHVQLVWETAYGASYNIQVSSNGSDWTTVLPVTGGNGAVDDLDVLATGRYVRLQGILRGTTYGYSLYEFGIYQ
jgi:hypothetical protein